MARRTNNAQVSDEQKNANTVAKSDKLQQELDAFDKLTVEDADDNANATDAFAALSTAEDSTNKYSVVEKLVKKGIGRLCKGLTVTGVRIHKPSDFTTVEQCINRMHVILSLDKPIPTWNVEGRTLSGDLSYKLVLGCSAILSPISLSAGLRTCGKASLYADDILANPRVAQTLLLGAKVDILAEMCKKNTEYRSPFSTSDREAVVFDEDRIFHHLIDLKLSADGENLVDRRMQAIAAFAE